jgi:glucosyl-dolichyl phosphate glucuronosyltransferase
MNVTVIVCTYNRYETLAKALKSVSVSRLPDSVEWEVLVVDNNSRDETREVVEDFGNRHPGRFRYLFEPQPGKSFALNAGIRESRGEILAFMDDDVIVEPMWLQNLTTTLYTSQWAGTGGRTCPAQSVKVPRWLAMKGPYSLGGILAAAFDFGDEPCELENAPYGANMAFRKAMFEKYGCFRTDLGPSPSREIPRPNEDTEFGRRLMAGGEHLRYEPSAIAYHPVLVDRIKKEYFLTWWFDYGRAEVREASKKPDFFGIPRHYPRILKTVVTLLVPRTVNWVLSVNPQRRFYLKCSVWATVGQIVEICRQVHSDKGQRSPKTPTEKECRARM